MQFSRIFSKHPSVKLETPSRFMNVISETVRRVERKGESEVKGEVKGKEEGE